MLDVEMLENLYAMAFAMHKEKNWLSLPWDFMIGIHTQKYGTWYGLPMLDNDKYKQGVGFVIYDKEEGLPVIRHILDQDRMEKASRYEGMSFYFQEKSYYITYENKSDLDKDEAAWLTAYCKKHDLVLRRRRSFPSFQYSDPGFELRSLENGEEIALCEKFLSALAALDALLAKKELLPKQGQAMSPLNKDLTVPSLTEQSDGSWQLGREILPPAGTLHWTCLVPNDFDTVRFKRFPKSGNVWQMEKFAHLMFDPDSISRGRLKKLIDAGKAPYIDSLAVYDETQGHVMLMDNFVMRVEGQNGIMSFLADAMAQSGRPMQIVVGSEETYEFIRKFCQRLDIQLIMDEVPQLEKIRNNVLECRDPMENFDDEEWLPADPDGDWDDEPLDNHGHAHVNRFSGMDKSARKNSTNWKNFRLEDVIDMMNDISDAARTGNKKVGDRASARLEEFFDICANTDFLLTVDNEMLGLLLNLAMISPMDSEIFLNVVGEYKRRLLKLQAGHLVILDDVGKRP